ncbi:sensor histidine kinase [Ferdinandcohnia sp. SAFN-114]|uniref:sensor histidine kinase n=1 Tax=Ferdinandcohnia sp. SAFN-114 TaxID=3387275 RepID=UPI003F7F4F5E
MRISVQDDGPGMDQDRINQISESMKTGSVASTRGKGIAISNVYKRLKLYYNENLHPELLIESEPDKGTRISFEIPINGGN